MPPVELSQGSFTHNVQRPRRITRVRCVGAAADTTMPHDAIAARTRIVDIAVAVDLMVFTRSPGYRASWPRQNTLGWRGNQERRSCTVKLHYGVLL